MAKIKTFCFCAECIKSGMVKNLTITMGLKCETMEWSKMWWFVNGPKYKRVLNGP